MGSGGDGEGGGGDAQNINSHHKSYLGKIGLNWKEADGKKNTAGGSNKYENAIWEKEQVMKRTEKDLVGEKREKKSEKSSEMLEKLGISPKSPTPTKTSVENNQKNPSKNTPHNLLESDLQRPRAEPQAQSDKPKPKSKSKDKPKSKSKDKSKDKAQSPLKPDVNLGPGWEDLQGAFVNRWLTDKYQKIKQKLTPGSTPAEPNP